jgi:hypothetical protein
VAIAKAIEEAIGERRGRGNQENFPELRGTQTRDVAAEKAGFGNPKTYQQARRVVEKGVQELVEAMDAATTQTARRKAIYEALHPEARAEEQRKKGLNVSAETVSALKEVKPFTADTAAKTGLTERTVQLYAQVGERLADEVKEAIAWPPRAAGLHRRVWLME